MQGVAVGITFYAHVSITGWQALFSPTNIILFYYSLSRSRILKNGKRFSTTLDPTLATMLIIQMKIVTENITKTYKKSCKCYRVKIFFFQNWLLSQIRDSRRKMWRRKKKKRKKEFNSDWRILLAKLKVLKIPRLRRFALLEDFNLGQSESDFRIIIALPTNFVLTMTTFSVYGLPFSCEPIFTKFVSLSDYLSS